MTVLVVDDDDDVRDCLQMALELRGFEVVTAGNGVQALERMRARPPDLVLLDLMMPIMSGAELLDIVAKDEALSRVPIIVVSAWPEEAAQLHGVRAFVKKPIDLSELLNLMR